VLCCVHVCCYALLCAVLCACLLLCSALCCAVRLFVVMVCDVVMSFVYNESTGTLRLYAHVCTYLYVQEEEYNKTVAEGKRRLSYKANKAAVLISLYRCFVLFLSLSLSVCLSLSLSLSPSLSLNVWFLVPLRIPHAASLISFFVRAYLCTCVRVNRDQPIFQIPHQILTLLVDVDGLLTQWYGMVWCGAALLCFAVLCFALLGLLCFMCGSGGACCAVLCCAVPCITTVSCQA